MGFGGGAAYALRARRAFGYRGRVQDWVRRGAVFFAAVALWGAAGAARAADPPERLIGGTSTCPAPSAVRTEVELLMPRERLNARLRTVGGAGPPVEIVDLGAPFQVVAAGNVREYRDEARDCSYRARVAALFVALVLGGGAIQPAGLPPTDAPAVTPPLTTPLPAVVSAAPSAPGSTTPQRARLRLALGAGVEGGIGSDARVGQAGLGLRITSGAGRWALALGATALAPVDTSIGGIALRQWRIPADVSVRAQSMIRFGEHRALEPYGELGVAVALLRESALDLATRDTRTSAELGVRAAAGVHLAGGSRIAPFFELHAEVVPSPPAISALPRGVVGHTPLVWIGAAAGAAWRLF